MKEDYLFAVIEKFLIGIAVISGLILASCLSALPSAVCATMAKTYGFAISDFGFLGLGALSQAIGLAPAIQVHARPSKFQSALLITSTVFIGLWFFATVLAANDNLIRATTFCMNNKDASAPPLELDSPFRFWAHFSARWDK